MWKWIKIALELIIGGAILFWGVRLVMTVEPTRISTSKKQTGPVKVVVEEIKSAKLDDALVCLGTVTARESVDITAQVTEKVTSVGFQDGDSVKKGDVLVMLENDTEKVAVELADLSIAEHAREQERLAWLLKEDAIAQKDLDDRETRLKMAKAERAKAQTDLADRIITAPFDGILGLRLVSVGDLVTPGTRITTLDDIEQIYVDFQVPEKYAARLSVGLPFKASNVAYPEASFEGRIRAVDVRISSQTRSVQVRGMIENKDHRLKPGMLLTVQLDIGKSEALVVPESSILSLGEKQYVYVLGSDRKKVRQIEIKIGRRSGRLAEATEGLSAGMFVVTDGSSKVTDNQAVTVEVAK